MGLFQRLKKEIYKTEFWFGVALFGVVFISMYSGLADGDYYWQADLGRRIVTEGDFNGCYKQVWGTLGVHEYYDHEWLTNVLFYICSLFDMRGIMICKALILTMIYTSVCSFIKYFTKDKYVTSIGMAYILIILFIYSTVFFKVKAYCISIAFVLYEIKFLCQYNESKSNKCFIKMLILCVLWNNMHSGSILLMFGVAGLYWLCCLREYKSLVFGIVCVLSILLNPYGYKLILFNLKHNSDKYMKQVVLDWKAIDAKTSLGVVCVLLVFLVLVAVFLVLRKREHIQNFDLFCSIYLFVVLFLGFQSVRHLIYLIPVALIVGIDLDYEIKYNVLPYIGISLCFIALLNIVNVVKMSDAKYNVNYAFDFVDDELEDLILRENDYGLFTQDIDVVHYGKQTFYIGEYPLVSTRVLDTKVMLNGGVSDIERVIDYYGIDKLIFWKYDNNIDYYLVECSLYQYLIGNDNYELLYDKNGICYFKEK